MSACSALELFHLMIALQTGSVSDQIGEACYLKHLRNFLLTVA